MADTDLLDRLLGHDAWTTQQVLAAAAGLTDAQLDQDFDIGHRTVRATLAHLIGNVEVWTDLMAERPVRRGEPRGRAWRNCSGATRRPPPTGRVARARQRRGPPERHPPRRVLDSHRA
jgi:hypothetical protein